MNFGVRDILTNDDNPELFMQKAVSLIKRRTAAGQTETARIGKVCCFFSSKGGVGKTFLAVNTGRWISRTSDARTILVDLDLQFGDMDLYLDANSVQTIADLLEEVKNNSGRFTDFILDSYIHQVSPGLHLLSAPLAPEKSEIVTADAVTQLIKILKKRYDFVLLDTSAVLSDVILTVFDKSDRIFLVLDDEIPAVKNAGQTAQLLKKLNYPENKTDFVITGYTEKFSMDSGMLLKVLSRKPYARIPASPGVRESINQGYNLVEKKPSDPAARGILEFAQKLAAESGLQLTEKTAAQKGFSEFLSKAKKMFVKG
jgi:pilus assembly protein CpaE